MPATKRRPKAGDPVAVVWLDIAGGDHGEPDTPTCESLGYYQGYIQVRGRRCLLTHRSKHSSADYDTGWDCYPASIVVKVRVL